MKMKSAFKILMASFSLLLSANIYAQRESQQQVIDSSKTDSPSAKIDTSGNIFTVAEVEASVDKAKWRRHLESKLLSYMTKAMKAGMKAGAYTVMVRFVVETDGSISDVKALNDPGFQLAQGAIEVVKTGPKWKPAMQNGYFVRSYHTQSVGFLIRD